MDLATFRSELRTRIGVPDDDAYFTDAVCKQLINATLHKLEGEADWPWLETKETVATVNAQEAYTPGASWIRTIAVKGADSVPLERVSIEEIDADTGSAANPRRFAVIEQKLYVRPIPTGIVNLTHRFIRSEPDLAADGESPLVPSIYHQAIVEAAASFAFRRAHRIEDAKVAAETYDAWLKSMLKRVDPGSAEDGSGKTSGA